MAQKAHYPQPMSFDALLRQRWTEACRATHLNADDIKITWDLGPYPHFNSDRGYAVAMAKNNGIYHIRFAPKTLKCQVHRADGLIRHEIGHIIDFLIPAPNLDVWASVHGVRLPDTAERRADAIALAIWGEPIRYDEDTVQSTRVGVSPRPEHLGL